MAVSRDRDWDVERLTEANWEMIPFLRHSGVIVEKAERGYVKIRMPFEPNVNHVGMMYAGALFTLAEVPGGTLFITTFDPKRFYPIVKNLNIRFRRPAMTDVSVEVRISEEQASQVLAEAEKNGKADYSWQCELVDVNGEVVAITENEYQIRAFNLD